MEITAKVTNLIVGDKAAKKPTRIKKTTRKKTRPKLAADRLGHTGEESQHFDPAPAVAVPAKADKPSAVDALDRGHYVRALAAMIMNRNTEVPLTIGIYGPWGSGKSSFMAQLRGQLLIRHQVVDFNPWRYNDAEQMWNGLILTVARSLDQQLSLVKRFRILIGRSPMAFVSKWQKRSAAASKKVGNWLTVVLTGLGIWTSGTPGSSGQPAPSGMRESILPWLEDTILVRWIVEAGLLDWFTREVAVAVIFVIVGLVVLLKMVRTVGRPFSTQFEAYLRGFRTDREQLRQLTHGDLAEIAGIVRDYSTNGRGGRKPPIIIMLDDLDRCPPDRLVEVLEAVNLFLVDLPVVTVFGVDSKVIRHAVAEQYNFMLGDEATHREKEDYGRFFLEKIIHIPFQLPPVEGFNTYIKHLIHRRDEEAETAEDEKRKNIRVRHGWEFLRTRGLLKGILLAPLVLSFDIMWAFHALGRNADLRWQYSIVDRSFMGLPLTVSQEEWLVTQGAQTRESVRAVNAGMCGVGFWRRLSRIDVIMRSAKEAKSLALAHEVEIEDEDAVLLQRFASDLRGNPRSVKRFVNTYQLAKGIIAQLDAETTNMPTLENLASWLVLLQNWPYEASTLYAKVRADPALPKQSWKAKVDGTAMPPGMKAYIDRNFKDLQGLANSQGGFEIAGCFCTLAPERREDIAP